jgi:predicted peroxiredoxin
VAQDVPLVEEINWLAEDAFCAAYRIGTAEKYPEIFATKNDDTLILRDSAGKLSSITFACAKGLIAETARYGVRVVAFKQVVDLQEARPVWRCPQEGDKQ